MRIRDATSDDLQAILCIEYKCFKDPYPLGLLNRLRVMHPDGFLVAETDGKVVGYVIGVIRWGATGHVLAIGIDPLFRRQRVGTTLMKHVMDRLMAKGARLIRLESRKSNIEAQQFYYKLSFKRMEEIPYYYEDGETAVVMELYF